MNEKTTHLYGGKPDARQGDENVKPSRFRPVYRALSAAEKALHDQIKTHAEELERLISLTPTGRYQSLALTDLESSVMWAVKGITQ